jgi:hypothetical protein
MAIKTPPHIRSYNDAWDCFIKNKHKLMRIYQEWERDIKPHLQDLGLDYHTEHRNLMRRAGTMIQQWVGTDYARDIMCLEEPTRTLLEEHGGVAVMDQDLEGFQVTASVPSDMKRRDSLGATKL